MDTVTLLLAPNQPFDFAGTLTSAGQSGLLQAAVSVDDITAALLVTAEPALHAVRCTLVSEQPLPEHRQHILAERAGRWLGLHDDLRPFYALAEGDTALAPLCDRLHGYHPLRMLSTVEAASWALLSRRTPEPLARRRLAALAARFGATLVVDGATLTAFPAAARLATLAPAALLPYAGDLRRAEQIIAAARALDAVDEAWLRGGPIDAVDGWLQALPGCGAREAALVLLLGLGRMERAPLDDLPLRAAIAEYYGGCTAETAAGIAARYGPWQGYWALYLTRGASMPRTGLL